MVAIAHAVDVSVEAELEALAGSEFSNEESGQEVYTNPRQARHFVEKTGIDALAVSIGTVHGMYKGTPRVDVDVLKKIAACNQVRQHLSFRLTFLIRRDTEANCH